jgi:hypothetical protein
VRPRVTMASRMAAASTCAWHSVDWDEGDAVGDGAHVVGSGCRASRGGAAERTAR